MIDLDKHRRYVYGGDSTRMSDETMLNELISARVRIDDLTYILRRRIEKYKEQEKTILDDTKT